MILTVCTDLSVQRSVHTAVWCRETVYDSHNKDTLSQSSISHRRHVDDHRLLICCLRAMNGMIAVGCLGVVCQCGVSSVL